MCIKAIWLDPSFLRFVPDQYKTHEMCDDVVWHDSFSLQYVPNWFVTQGQIKLWHDYDDYCNNDRLIEWYDGYKKTQGPESKN